MYAYALPDMSELFCTRRRIVQMAFLRPSLQASYRSIQDGPKHVIYMQCMLMIWRRASPLFSYQECT